MREPRDVWETRRSWDASRLHFLLGNFVRWSCNGPGFAVTLEARLMGTVGITLRENDRYKIACKIGIFHEMKISYVFESRSENKSYNWEELLTGTWNFTFCLFVILLLFCFQFSVKLFSTKIQWTNFIILPSYCFDVPLSMSSIFILIILGYYSYITIHINVILI